MSLVMKDMMMGSVSILRMLIKSILPDGPHRPFIYPPWPPPGLWDNAIVQSVSVETQAYPSNVVIQSLLHCIPAPPYQWDLRSRFGHNQRQLPLAELSRRSNRENLLDALPEKGFEVDFGKFNFKIISVLWKYEPVFVQTALRMRTTHYSMDWVYIS